MIDRAPDMKKLEAPPGVRQPVRLPGPYAPSLVPVDTKAVLSHLVKIIRKQKWKLFHFIAIAMILAVILQFAFPRLYSATAILRVDRHQAAGAVGQEAAQISEINDMDEIITTDMELAQSDPVLRPVAEKYHLLDFEKRGSGLLSFLKPKRDAEAIRRAKDAPVQLPELKLTRPANTYLIRVTYRAWNDPRLTANVANGIGESLIQHLNGALDKSYADLSSSIRRDMDQLHSKMEASSARLAQYEKDLNMVDPDQRSTVLTARMSQLLLEYTSAQADRLRRESRMEGQDGSPTLAEAEATEADREKQSLLDQALERLAGARQQFVAARSYYGENHPEYRKAKQQLDEAEAQVDRVRVATGDKNAAEYRQAMRREKLLKKEFDQTKAEVDGLKAKAIEYGQLKSDADNDRKIYQDLEARTREADVNRQFRDATIQFVAPALPPDSPIFPKLAVNLPIALLVAAILGLLGAIAADALDTTFSDADEVTSRMKLEVLATLPDVRRLAASSELSSIVAPGSNLGRSARMTARYDEAIRMLRNGIGLAALNQPMRTVLVTSPGPGEGKSMTASHLAAACAQAGKKVLLIDADLRRPSLHKKFDITKKIGLGDVIAHKISPADTIVEVEVPGLFVMPAGPPTLDAADLISQGFASVLMEVARNFDLVIVDAPPMLGLSESQELAGMVDGVLLVAKADATSAKSLGEALGALARTRANLLGIVINQVKLSNLKGFGYYYHMRREDESGSLG